MRSENTLKSLVMSWNTVNMRSRLNTVCWRGRYIAYHWEGRFPTSWLWENLQKRKELEGAHHVKNEFDTSATNQTTSGWIKRKTWYNGAFFGSKQGYKAILFASYTALILSLTNHTVVHKDSLFLALPKVLQK